MRKAAKQIILLAAALLALCLASRMTVFSQFSVYMPLPPEEDGAARTEEPQVQVEKPGVLRAGKAERRARFARVPIYPEAAGETDVSLLSADPDALSFHTLQVDRFHTVYDFNTGNFTGDTAVLIGVTLFWLLVSAIMLWHFSQAKGADFYAYGTIYYAGFFFFALSSGLVMLSVTVSRVLHPETYTMLSAYSAISGASARYMRLSSPLILCFAVAMAASNVALLRHEHPRLQNGLGLLISGLLVLGEAVGWYLFTRDFSGSDWEYRLDSALQNTYATVFIYCQCMLTGAVICGAKAARHVPGYGKDFIIILGCWFRSDGSLPPLLRGRVDRALAFWRDQKAATGKEAFFIPSGGQGKNESMPEAEAMRRYLLAHGVPEKLILPEEKSANTFQNMAFSREIIRRENPAGRAAFSTTNYHVFRSGLWARRAGLSAEGMGSKTKWWFWPNAFMRETAGLLRCRWKQEMLFLLMMLSFFGVLSVVLG